MCLMIGGVLLLGNYLFDVLVMVFLVVWVLLFCFFGVMLVYLENGLGWVFCMMIVVIVFDVGGYVVGVLFGKYLMVLMISLKKLWEGFVGLLVCGIIVMIIIVIFLVGKMLWIGVLFGVFFVFIIVLGDLVELQVKCDFGIKDMGCLLFGYGGLMDWFDGILFFVVVVWIVFILLF